MENESVDPDRDGFGAGDRDLDAARCLMNTETRLLTSARLVLNAVQRGVDSMERGVEAG